MKHTTFLQISLATAAAILATACSLGPTPAAPDRSAAQASPRQLAVELETAPCRHRSADDVVAMPFELVDARRDVIAELETAARARPASAYPVPSVADVIADMREAQEAP
jgi:hypothetical protein